MALYTELFSTFLKDGGTLPSSFSEIENFETLFVQKYFDREIGFETEEIFKTKLDYKASIVIPFYAEKITQQKLLLQALEKTSYNFKDSSSVESVGGEQNSTVTDQPVNAETSRFPSQTSHADSVTNSENRILAHDQDFTPNEIKEKINLIQNEIQSLLEKALSEFNNIFMVIY